MLYPYAISQTWLLYVAGVALCAGLFFDRGERQVKDEGVKG